MRFLDDRVRVAKVVFAFDAVSGLASVASGALFGAALSSDSPAVAFWTTLLPLGLLWLLICYGAYRGLTGGGVILQIVFWLFVAGHVFAFPVGTAVAAVCIWLWRELRTQPAPVSA